ncbi:MAG: PDZ domain-containing protein, partial [Polyangiaceae bacterium]
NAAENEWELGQKKARNAIGPWVWWRADGSLACRSTFDAKGNLDGLCRRFHPDGSPSMEARYVHGERWGKTRHTRSLKGDSPEDVHMEALPKNVFEIALTYVADETSPMLNAALTKKGVQAPPKSRLGLLSDVEGDIEKYLPGTALLAIGTVVDIAGQRFEPSALYYDGLAIKDGSSIRFAFEPPGERNSDVPPWQDPEYGTVLAAEEVKTKLVIAVDWLDALLAPGRRLNELGFQVEPEKTSVTVRSVDPKGPAKKAGLRAGDVIAKMNDRKVKCLLDYLEGRAEAAEARSVTLSVVRGKKTLAIEITAPLEN